MIDQAVLNLFDKRGLAEFLLALDLFFHNKGQIRPVPISKKMEDEKSRRIFLMRYSRLVILGMILVATISGCAMKNEAVNAQVEISD